VINNVTKGCHFCVYNSRYAFLYAFAYERIALKFHSLHFVIILLFVMRVYTDEKLNNREVEREEIERNIFSPTLCMFIVEYSTDNKRRAQHFNSWWRYVYRFYSLHKSYHYRVQVAFSWFTLGITQSYRYFLGTKRIFIAESVSVFRRLSARQISARYRRWLWIYLREERASERAREREKEREREGEKSKSKLQFS